jgi:hypothetical protein
MAYRIYAQDGATPVEIPQPLAASWETVKVGTNADLTERVSRYKRVRWTFGPMSEADYQLFQTYRPANGVVYFDTWKRPTGGVAGRWVKCRGIMPETIPGALTDGEYSGVAFTWLAVEEVA